MMDPSTRRRDTAVEEVMVQHQFIQESPRYLIAGVVLGILGFLVAVVPYMMRIFQHVIRDETIPKDEVPPTVSELVSRWDTVEARIFFGFELTAANLILLSWYPFKMRSACCIPMFGGCKMRIGCCSVAWATFRQFVPPIGLILVACCPTVKDNVQDFNPANFVLIGVHCIAAGMMFVGFILAEAHALSMPILFTKFVPLPCKCKGVGKAAVNDDNSEYRVRWLTWHVAAGSFSLFLIAQTPVYLRSKPSRKLNIFSFTLEVVAGIAMLLNHGAIWYFSKERLGRDFSSGMQVQSMESGMSASLIDAGETLRGSAEVEMTSPEVHANAPYRPTFGGE